MPPRPEASDQTSTEQSSDDHTRRSVSGLPTKRTGGQINLDPTQVKPARACQGCRTSKVRCIQPDSDQPCARCVKQRRPCFPIEDSNKRQKQSDSRSTSRLETCHAALTDTLRHRHEAVSSDAVRTATVEPHVTPEGITNSLLQLTGEYNTARIEAAICCIVDDETTSMVFQHFTANMLPHFPFVDLPPDTNIEDFRKNNSILLLAILDAAGDGFCSHEASRKLRKLLSQICSIMHTTTTCSVSLIQALIISATWNRDIELEDAREKLDVFQISNTAANMAICMGLDDTIREYSWSGRMPIQSSSMRDSASEYQIASLEGRRTWLACYYICSHTSIAQQTTNIMRWTRSMDECLEVLEIHPVGLASDKILCSHVRVQHIFEEAAGQLTSSALGPTAAEVTYRAAKRQFADWASSVSIWNDPLKLSHQFATIYLHEVAMTSNSSVINETEYTDCLTAAQDLLDTFLSLEMSLIRNLPTAYYVQLTHGAIVLAKLHFAASRLLNPGDAVQRIQCVDVNHYLIRLIQKFSGWGTLWPAWRLAEKFRTLRDMVRRHGNGEVPSEIAWLNVWTLKEATPDADWCEAIVAMEQQQHVEQAESHEVGETAMLSIPDGNHLAWNLLEINPADAGQSHSNYALPSASLDIAQLNDWFGTDLDTSTFDFDGNLQSMIQFFD